MYIKSIILKENFKIIDIDFNYTMKNQKNLFIIENLTWYLVKRFL